MEAQSLDAKLNRLVTGLADKKIQRGEEFIYDGGSFFAEDVANTLLPSILVLAQHLSEKLGIGGFGYRFALIQKTNPVFPLVAELETDLPPAFMRVAPFVQEVFDKEVMACRFDLLQLFEKAARLLDPSFSVGTHTSYIPSGRTASERAG